MDDKGAKSGRDPEERALTGHPDHPPREADSTVDENRELLRRDREEREPNGADKPGSPGEATTLPGYGG